MPTSSNIRVPIGIILGGVIVGWLVELTLADNSIQRISTTVYDERYPVWRPQ